jgi:hypothetical protein
MPNIFEHELGSYKREIEERQHAIDLKPYKDDPSINLTHFSLGISNRANLIVVGLTSLVEARLLDLSEEIEKQTAFKLNDLKGDPLTRLKVFLSKTGVIDFERFVSWAPFKQLYTIRNVVVHGYGGLVAPSDMDKLKMATESLDVAHVLFGNRIRFDTPALLVAHQVASQTISEIQASQQP